MNLKGFLAGVEILRPFYKDPNGYHLGADHDVIYVYATDDPLPQEAVVKMLDLGFHQESGAAEGSPQDYRPDESWWAYV